MGRADRSSRGGEVLQTARRVSWVFRDRVYPLVWLSLFAAAGAVAAAESPASALPVVREGRPVAVIVTAERPTAVASYAAQELRGHVEMATGAVLRIVTEGAVPADANVRIFLGATEAARGAGIDVRQLAPETAVLRSAKDALFIAGNDAAGEPLESNTSAGTLFGVYEWLDRELGARWLWPGPLGTHVPKTSTVVISAINETVAPRFFQRHLRTGLGFKAEHPALGFTTGAAADYAQVQSVLLRRHRMGRGQRISYGHAFTDWWEKYGKEHPEWFQLVNGKRGPVKKGARYSMCVSNPELQRQVVALWRARGGVGQGDRPGFINAVENDIVGLCECDKCQAWDGPPPPDVMKYYAPGSKVYGTRFASDRYARFALAIQQLAARENPNTTVVGYVYFNYFQAPTSGVKLNPNILLGYCPSSGWYPREDEEHAWYQRQWRGWAETGARLFVRTNYFLDGYCMPYIFAHQFADDFQHHVKNGLVGSDFDSLTGHWATQGPNLYLLLRLHARPDANPDRLLAEYYSAFGPAASEVQAYFDYWERYTMDNRPLIGRAFADRIASRWRTWAKVAQVVFPPECFAPAEVMLQQAAVAAARDATAAARVKFLQTGLAHARLCARVAGLLSLADPAATVERGQKELLELLAFRRAHEREWIGNFNHLAWVEDLSWKLANETRREPDLYP